MRMRLSLLLVLTTLLFGTTSPHAPSENPANAPVESDVGLIKQLFLLQKMKPDVQRVGLIWKKDVANQEAKLRTTKRAAASIGGKLFVGYVEDKSEVAEKFRLLTRKHDVQALWIIENDGIVDASAPRKYLVENAIEKGVPLLAPSQDWVDAGAPLTIARLDGEIRIMLNEPAADATGLQIPEKFEEKTKPIVAAN